MRQTLRRMAQFEIAFLGCTASVTDVEAEKSPLTNQLSPSNRRSAILVIMSTSRPKMFAYYTAARKVSARSWADIRFKDGLIFNANPPQLGWA